MSDVTAAQSFVESVELPAPPATSIGVAKDPFDYDAAKAQAAVVGADLVAFVAGVTPEDREDIVNASLLAQLVAKKKVASPTSLDGWTRWYDAYFDVLSRIGFAIQDKGFSVYSEKSDDFQAHEAILEVATALLGNAPGALAAITSTLKALQKMAPNESWIRLFNRESQSANTARFQTTLVGLDADGKLFVSLVAFGLEATTKVTQVLFFKFKANTVKLQEHSGKVSINRDVLAGVRDQVAQKLGAVANEYVRGLEI
jgi:hypothetical protein